LAGRCKGSATLAEIARRGVDFATFKLEPIGVSMTDIGGLMHMTGTAIVIDTIGGKSGGGPVQSAGRGTYHMMTL